MAAVIAQPLHLVDSNILIYAHDASSAVKQARARELLSHLTVQRSGALSTQILGEFFVNATRKIRIPLSIVEAEQVLNDILAKWTVFDLTPATVVEAVRGLRRYQLAYWDALIWATAKLNRVPNVLSEDFNTGALIEGVRFLNPFDPSFDPARL